MNNIIFFILGYLTSYIVCFIHGFMIVKNLSKEEKEYIDRKLNGEK